MSRRAPRVAPARLALRALRRRPPARIRRRSLPVGRACPLIRRPDRSYTGRPAATSTSVGGRTAGRCSSRTGSAAIRTCGVSSPGVRGGPPDRAVRPCRRGRVGPRRLRPGALRLARGLRGRRRGDLPGARARRRGLRGALGERDDRRRAREDLKRVHDETRAISHTPQQSLFAGGAAARRAVRHRRALPARQRAAGGRRGLARRLHAEGGRVAVVVGDVVGRGLPAATAMGQLRSAVRALAGTGAGPSALLRHLDTLVAQVETAQYATPRVCRDRPGQRSRRLDRRPRRAPPREHRHRPGAAARHGRAGRGTRGADPSARGGRPRRRRRLRPRVRPRAS